MRLIFFGSGYCSNFIIPLIGNNIEIICTHKNKIKTQAFDKNLQIKRILFDEFFHNFHQLLNTSSIILNSIPPINEKDILVEKLKEFIKKQNSIKWYGYFSSTSVYGDQDGKWVTEDTIPKPTTKKPVIAPDLNEISNALSILSVAACVVLTLALTETNIPT